MILNKNQRLICSGQMLLRTPKGKPVTVPVFQIVPAEKAGTSPTAELMPNERLVFVGTVESKLQAEERYKALKEGEMLPDTHAAPLYIKETVDSSEARTELTESEKRALNPLISDLIKDFSAAMDERESAIKQTK